jgi:hypothetical protein
MRLTLKSLAAGLLLALVVHIGFFLFGAQFFIDGRSPFQINFFGGAAIGLLLGLAMPLLVGAPRGERLRSIVLMLVPFLMWEAAVTSHFQVFFRDLNPVMDKVYGALMVWATAFALIGGLIRR